MRIRFEIVADLPDDVTEPNIFDETVDDALDGYTLDVSNVGSHWFEVNP